MAEFTNRIFESANSGGNHLIVSRSQREFMKVEDSGLSIKLPISGVELYSLNSKQYKISTGEFLLVNRNQSLAVAVDSRTEVIGKCVYLDIDMVTELYNDICYQNVLLEGKEQKKIVFFDGVYKLEQNGISNVLKNLMYTNEIAVSEDWYRHLALELLKHQIGVENIMSKLRITKSSTKRELYQRVYKAKSYIIDNYKQDLTIEKISMHSCISKFHLIRTFKEVFGSSPYDYLIGIRLDKATELIKNKSMTLEEVAIETGFKGRQNLTRNFRKQYGYNLSEHFYDR